MSLPMKAARAAQSSKEAVTRASGAVNVRCYGPAAPVVTAPSHRAVPATAASQDQQPAASMLQSPLCKLPGDPSLVVFTNVSLGDQKTKFMKAASEAVASSLSKPESYVTVCIMDEQSLLFGGTDAPCAIAQLNSIGAINLENNRSFSEAFSALIAEHGIAEDRYYVNFFDVPRENVAFKSATFAG